MWTQADLAALDKAIATGAKRVRYGSGESAHETEFRSLAEMLAARALILDALASDQSAGRVTFAEHVRD